MPVTDPATTPRPAAASADGAGIDAVAARLETAAARFAELHQERAREEGAWRRSRAQLQQEGERAIAEIAERAEQPEREPSVDAVLAELKAARERWTARVTEASSRLRHRIRARMEDAIRQLERDPPPLAAPKAPSTELLREMQSRSARAAKAIIELKEQLEAASVEFDRCCVTAGIVPRAPGKASAPLPPWDVPKLLDLVRQDIAGAEKTLADFRESGGYAVCRPGALILAHVLVALPILAVLAAAAWLIQIPRDITTPVAVGGVGAELLVMAHTAVRRWLLRRRAVPVLAMLLRAQERLNELERTRVAEPDPALLLQQKLERIQPDRRAEQEQELRDQAQAAQAKVRRREAALHERVKARFAKTRESLEQDAGRRRERRSADLRAEGERATTALAARLAERDAQWTETLATIERRWKAEADDLRAFAEAARRKRAARHPGWSDGSWTGWTPASAFATDLPLGEARTTLTRLATPAEGSAFAWPEQGAIALPVALAFPAPSALLVRVEPERRPAALELANTLVTRALASFPPGKMRLTLIDPVGLGDSFAGLLDIADHDDAILGGGILSDPQRIERGLEDLVSHLELVIQKHLRGRYATIDDYNREAGEMQEALRLVVVADFPAGFSERAFDHLSVLLRSGARCGVHVVILHDERKALPPAIDAKWFRSAGVAIREAEGRLVIDRPGLEACEFAPEPAPPAALATRLISAIGRDAVSAKRIEVPFESVAPPDGKRWTLDASKALSVPIGKRGADRLQHFELGRGTCQHALIGGRTGSGKSTLFHVLITSAALWYSPRELEFHLIDFKKGVEFKSYATNKLPHARVIAIESDREFGLSVLRQLDGELTRRGDLFRAIGAQDLAAHRQAAGASGGEYLPRVLLLIDEFQEFFTEDDAIARDAALLLDRFVRQGRAFGLHVVLGSQTLGGSYALAKSSIGQMGVRIALPCNENDAHLLLHEDNDAARLLNRPGDGIYNDRAGLAEGNSPFQVCWLPEEAQTRSLQALAARAKAEGWKPARSPVVFEGNGPSRLEDDSDLSTLLGKPYAAGDARIRASIGQSSSLKGAAEVALASAAGGNLLIIGQNREAAAATCGAIALGLAARHAPGKLRLLAIDGEDQDGPFAQLQAGLAAALPHAAIRREARGITETLAELATLLERRQSGEDADHSPVLLTVFALQRLRQLRPDDDLGFGSGTSEPPAERFARILANGPEYGIHTIVWSDSLASVQRGLARKAMRDFDQRILFQMSAADSSELIDEDAASRLGLYTALLSVLAEGRREKFRPFSLPSPGFLAEAGKALRVRFSGVLKAP